jgi:hypothetical protein
MQAIHLNIHSSIKLINSFSSIYKNFKMINISYMICILNFVFTVVIYATRWTKHDHICICFEFAIYLQFILIFVFTIVFYVMRLTKQDLSYICFEEF